jgi:outer membrane protein
MNKALIVLTSLLLAAVVFLFVKVFNMNSATPAETEKQEEPKEKVREEKPAKVDQPANVPTGRIAYVNIDRLNEESLEIRDLVAESKRRQGSIEASVESLQQRYQQKVEEFQRSQRAGIAPESELRAKAKEIEDIEREAANKQVQMDRLTMDISDKNAAFQQTVRDYLVRWNGGKYDFVLSFSEAIPTVLLGNSSLEVTDEVIEGLNNEYKDRKTKKK